MNQTKEQLIKELTVASLNLENWVSRDKISRKEFAKAFNWSKRDSYNGETQWKDPTWVEIFVELGRMQGRKDFRILDDEVMNLQRDVDVLIEKDLNKNKE